MNQTARVLLFTLVISSLTYFSARGQQPKIRVACVGNSITWGGVDSTCYPGQLAVKLGAAYDVRNFGSSGRTLLQHGDYPYRSEKVFRDALAFDPHIVIIKLGTNDTKPQNRKFISEFYGDYMALVAEFRKSHRRPQIYVSYPVPVFKTNWGINDSTLRTFMPIIDSVRAAAGTFFIDFNSPLLAQDSLFPDGVHPSPAGYAKMARIVYDTITAGQSGYIRYFVSRTDTIRRSGSTITATKLFWNVSGEGPVTLNGAPVRSTDSLLVSAADATPFILRTRGSIRDSLAATLFPR